MGLDSLHTFAEGVVYLRLVKLIRSYWIFSFYLVFVHFRVPKTVVGASI